MEAPHFQPAISGPTFNPFSHSTVPGNMYLAPENNAGHAHVSYYNRQVMPEIEGGLIDSTMSAGRGQFKRKSPAISGPFERASSIRFYGPGSSSGSSQMLPEQPTSDCHIIPSGPLGIPQYRGSSLLIRNVRSRSRLDFEPSTVRTHISSYSSGHYDSTTHPTNHSGTVDLGNLNAEATTREWNGIPFSAAACGRIPTSDMGRLSHETNPFLVGGSTAEIRGYHQDSIPSRHPVSSSQYVHAPIVQTATDGHINYSRRVIPSYRAGPSYSHAGHPAAFSDNGLHSLSETSSSRHSRPCSAGGWHNSYNNGRQRIATERFQSIPSLVDAHDRLRSETGNEFISYTTRIVLKGFGFNVHWIVRFGALRSHSHGGANRCLMCKLVNYDKHVPTHLKPRSQALMMVDHSPFYSGPQFDEYLDMRLDIDNMDYEELLALGERMGNVNTGLSESMISNCLRETVYHFPDQHHEEGTCAICLEEYKNEEAVGTLKNCGHEYHVGCIRKWLLVKNVCPICKAVALSDSSKQE
ncbi:unnamed protein product [Ilex paraguariensis]|uniref:RING-type E3 ubiquitin transferase n=1 Tax=Ilex paraguariensis TaxID=185542 RepID=A0ABC8QZN6_9AQUA